MKNGSSVALQLRLIAGFLILTVLGSQTAFGPRGAATILTKATTISAIVFMLTSITLSVMAFRRPASRSVLQGTQTTAPKQPQGQQRPQPAPKPTTH